MSDRDTGLVGSRNAPALLVGVIHAVGVVKLRTSTLKIENDVTLTGCELRSDQVSSKSLSR